MLRILWQKKRKIIKIKRTFTNNFHAKLTPLPLATPLLPIRYYKIPIFTSKKLSIEIHNHERDEPHYSSPQRPTYFVHSFQCINLSSLKSWVSTAFTKLGKASYNGAPITSMNRPAMIIQDMNKNICALTPSSSSSRVHFAVVCKPRLSHQNSADLLCIPWGKHEYSITRVVCSKNWNIYTPVSVLIPFTTYNVKNSIIINYYA